MKVRCIRLVNSKGAPVERSPWLTMGKIYEVLSLSSDRNGVRVRLVGDGENGVAIFRLDEFEIVSDTIPSNWVIFLGAGSAIHLAPKAWMEPGFWERYYDSDPDAVRMFEEERKKIATNRD